MKLSSHSSLCLYTQCSVTLQQTPSQIFTVDAVRQFIISCRRPIANSIIEELVPSEEDFFDGTREYPGSMEEEEDIDPLEESMFPHMFNSDMSSRSRSRSRSRSGSRSYSEDEDEIQRNMNLLRETNERGNRLY